MIAADTSSLLAFLAGDTGRDIERLDEAINQGIVVLPAVVVTELFSSRRLAPELVAILRQIPILDILTGFWERSGRLRGKVIAHGHKAKLADALIAQNCLDHEVPLITRDKDFRHYTAMGLDLI